MTKITKQEQDSKLLRGQTGSLDSFHIYKPNQELTMPMSINEKIKELKEKIDYPEIRAKAMKEIQRDEDEYQKAQAIVDDWEM